MVEFTTNQRRVTRWDGSDWQEEVLSSSGVEVDDSSWVVLSGADAQEALTSADTVLSGIDYSTASGVVSINDAVNVSGTTAGTIGDLDVITMADDADSAFRFSFSVGAQPVDPVHVRILYAPTGAASSGSVKLDLDYNLFDRGDALDPGSYTFSKTNTDSLVAGDFEELRMASLTIPASEFSSAAAPIIVSAQVTRDTAVGGNYADDISVVAIYADNVPGGVAGNTAGYIGGNLTVDGDLTVEGNLVLEGGTVPASGTALGVSGSLVIADDYIYAAVSTNLWKRSSLANF
jgi:hypothetical protein